MDNKSRRSKDRDKRESGHSRDREDKDNRERRDKRDKRDRREEPSHSKHKESDREHRDKRKDREEGSSRHKDKDRDRRDKHRDESEPRESKSKHKDRSSKDHEVKDDTHRDQRDKHKRKDKDTKDEKHDRHGDKDDDRRRRRDKDTKDEKHARHGDKDDDRRRRRDKDTDDEKHDRHRDKDDDRRRKRDKDTDDEKHDRHRDKDDDRRRRRDKDTDDEKHDRHRDKDDDRRRRRDKDTDDEKHDRHRDKDDDRRRKRDKDTDDEKHERPRDKDDDRRRKREKDTDDEKNYDKHKDKDDDRRRRDRDKYEDQSRDHEKRRDDHRRREKDHQDSRQFPKAYGDDETATKIDAASKHKEQLRLAMEEENSRTENKSSKHGKHSSHRDQSTAGHTKRDKPKVMNFNVKVSKATKRGLYLSTLVELDAIYYDLFELKPHTEYEVYMKSFGTANTQQRYTQYNEDAIEREIMTEVGDSKTCWTQHPPEGFSVCGYEDDMDRDGEQVGKYNAASLQKFIAVSSQIVITLLEERASRYGYSQDLAISSELNISTKYALFPPNLITNTRTPTSITSLSSQKFVVSYTMPKDATAISHPGMSCCWSLQSTTRPNHVLISNATHRCSCVSPYNPNIVFVGCDDGSICVYDLNESDEQHLSIIIPESGKVVTRMPTYSTSNVQRSGAHYSKIVCIQYLVLDRFSDKLHTTSFQIASLDENGRIVVWVVTSVPDLTLSGSPTDLGLRPGGRFKLVQSASISTMDQDLTDARTFTFYQQVTDPNLFYVGTDQGRVVKVSRTKNVTHPGFYMEAGALPCFIASLDCNKFNWKYFLAGSSEGVFYLYYVSMPQPVVTWARTTQGRPIRAIEWSKFSSTVFYVLDSANKFYFWDLSIRDSTPLVIESFGEKCVMSFTELVSVVGAETTIVVFGFKDGSIEAHRMKAEAMNTKEDNITKLERYLSTIL